MLVSVRASQIRSPRARTALRARRRSASASWCRPENHGEHVAPAHQAAGPHLRSTAPSTARSSSRSPVRVCPSRARALPSVARTSASRSSSWLRRASSRADRSSSHCFDRAALVPQHDALGWHATDTATGPQRRRPASRPCRRLGRLGDRQPQQLLGLRDLLAAGHRQPLPPPPATTSVNSQLEIVAKASQAMTLTPGDDLNETSRQRTRDQFELLREAHGTAIIVDTDDPADFTFICSSEHVLLEGAAADADPDDPTDAVNRLRQWFDDRSSEFGDVPDSPPQPRAGLARRFTLPTRAVPLPDGKDLLATLAEIDADPELGPGFARPDHLMHICGKGPICPATEPSETGFAAPWPPPNTADPNAGAGVRVVVIDTGWFDPTADPVANQPALPWSWLDGVTGEPEPDGIRNLQSGQLRAYAGHGTFVAGVVRAMAPKCSVHVLNLLIDRQQPGGGVLESQLVDDLYDALDREDLPHLINMSAGCPTRLNLPSRAFEDWRRDLETLHPDLDLVLVAAAGNNSSPWGFWPASFKWATGVGSLDRDGRVSDFSNWGDSVDVFALGRNLVNAFPNGTYVCHESPDRGDQRVFDNWLARWSGTSFAAPLVTGMIAAAMTAPQTTSARAARDRVLGVPQQMQSLSALTAPVVGADLLAVRQSV